MEVSMQTSSNVTISCSGTNHWYRGGLASKQVCVCGKFRLQKRRDYQPVQFKQVKVRKKRK